MTSRKDSYLSAEYLFGIAQGKFLVGDNNIATIIRLLEAASMNGHEEATWLLNKIKNSLVNWSDFPGLSEAWNIHLFEGDKSPRALGYLAAFHNSAEVIRLYAEPAAKAGDPLAQYIMGGFSTDTTSINYLKLSAAQGCHRAAMFLLAMREHLRGQKVPIEESKMVYLKAAEGGYDSAMAELASAYHESPSQENLMQEAKWMTRSVICRNHKDDRRLNYYLDHNGFPTSSGIKRSLEMDFTIGRELEAHQFFEQYRFGTAQAIRRCCEVYRQISATDRRRALLSYWCLRSHVYRDVAVMIARLVYASRETDPCAWSSPKSN